MSRFKIRGNRFKAQGKRFLTDRGDEGGSVRWYIEPYEYANSMDSFLMLTDCGKSISLEFSCDNSSDYTKRLAKLYQLIEELSEFRQALHMSRNAAKLPRFYY